MFAIIIKSDDRILSFTTSYSFTFTSLIFIFSIIYIYGIWYMVYVIIYIYIIYGIRLYSVYYFFDVTPHHSYHIRFLDSSVNTHIY